MKAYANLEDVRPTIRNKPSGLKSDWHRTVSNASMPRQQMPIKYAQSDSLSASTSSSLSQSPLLDSDHSLSLLAMSPPSTVSDSSMPLFRGDLVPLIDKKAMEYQGHALASVVRIFRILYILQNSL